MPSITVRDIPEPIYLILKRAAELNHRSLNGEILARLQDSLFSRRLPPDEFLRRIDELRSHQKGETTLEEIDAAKRFGRE